MGTIYMIEDQIPEIKRSPWVDNFFRPLLITTMIMCFNFSLVNLVHFINPAWRSIYFLAGMLLTTVEAIYSYRILKHWKSRDISRFRYRLAEGVLLLFVLKLLSFGNKSVADIWAELQEMWVEPLTFLNLEFYMLVSLAFIAWIIATYTIGDFEALYDPYTFRTDNILPLHELTARFLWGGVLLVVISGISQWVARAGLSSLTNLQRPSLNGVILNVLLYFVLGLVLLSQANLTRLMVRWRVQKIEVAPSVVKQWAKYALAFLVVVAGLVFFLPTSYTLGFLASAALVVQFLLQIIIFIIQLILFLISLPFVWLFSFLEVTPTAQDLGAAPAFPTLPPSDANAGPLWFEVLRSLLFWLVVLGSVGYLVRVYLNDHPDLLASLQKFKPIHWLFMLFRYLWRQLQSLVETGMELLPHRVSVPANTGEASARMTRLRWGRRSPRERILAYYLNVLKRAADHGLVRRHYQTPYEHEPTLRQGLPAAQKEITNLTETFVRARYSRASVDPNEATVAKHQWQRIKYALKRLKREPN